ncbi:MAG: hypothetical protein COV44_03255 [Deltaproteobacteria bacterium CG11_big_fil_rev_8_21_14_0_20_45_16]|nr:MAG: hypothetical protein COV44_03255 [Deltaproteobacteria bacterium CG11_big_fil_rev_8_21_14_0_20_45_16]
MKTTISTKQIIESPESSIIEVEQPLTHEAKSKAMKDAWQEVAEEMKSNRVFAAIQRGELGVHEYKAILREIFHHARENPQIQALATSFFRGSEREFVKMFLKHATSEVGHDQLALNDLAALGEDVSGIPTERPLPATTALISYAFYQIQFRNPLGYIGYLFFLEYTPVQNGPTYLKRLREKGVPDSALSFIQEHATVDISHCRLIEKYVDQLIRTQDDLDEVCYAIRTTGQLYQRMLESAVKEIGTRKQWGQSPTETKKAKI